MSLIIFDHDIYSKNLLLAFHKFKAFCHERPTFDRQLLVSTSFQDNDYPNSFIIIFVKDEINFQPN